MIVITPTQSIATRVTQKLRESMLNFSGNSIKIINEILKMKYSLIINTISSTIMLSFVVLLKISVMNVYLHSSKQVSVL